MGIKNHHCHQNLPDRLIYNNNNNIIIISISSIKLWSLCFPFVLLLGAGITGSVMESSIRTQGAGITGSNNGIFYPNPLCDQAHGPCLLVLQFVALRPGTARSMEWVSSTSRRRPIRWRMSIPAHGRVKRRKAPIVVGSD